jgi:hypothetical protein
VAAVLGAEATWLPPAIPVAVHNIPAGEAPALRWTLLLGVGVSF